MRFTVVAEQEEDGRWSVWVPDLPGCASMGDTHDEALLNVRDAIASHIEGLKQDGLALPKPRTRIDSVTIDA